MSKVRIVLQDRDDGTYSGSKVWARVNGHYDYYVHRIGGAPRLPDGLPRWQQIKWIVEEFYPLVGIPKPRKLLILREPRKNKRSRYVSVLSPFGRRRRRPLEAPDLPLYTYVPGTPARGVWGVIVADGWLRMQQGHPWTIRHGGRMYVATYNRAAGQYEMRRA